MTALALMLSRLESPRRNRRGWTAKCPAHEDRTASLSVAEGDGGRVLVHCFAGCDVTDILAAIGLSISDLFPERIRDLSPLERDERRRLMRENVMVAAIGVVDSEASVILAAASMLDEGQDLSDADRDRLALAMQRVSDAREVFA